LDKTLNTNTNCGIPQLKRQVLGDIATNRGMKQWIHLAFSFYEVSTDPNSYFKVYYDGIPYPELYN